MVTRVWEEKEMGRYRLKERYKLAVIRRMNPEDLMCSIVTTGTNMALYNCKLLRAYLCYHTHRVNYVR